MNKNILPDSVCGPENFVRADLLFQYFALLQPMFEAYQKVKLGSVIPVVVRQRWICNHMMPSPQFSEKETEDQGDLPEVTLQGRRWVSFPPVFTTSLTLCYCLISALGKSSPSWVLVQQGLAQQSALVFLPRATVRPFPRVCHAPQSSSVLPLPLNPPSKCHKLGVTGNTRRQNTDPVYGGS